MRNLSIRCLDWKMPGQKLRPPRRSSASMSFSRLFLGGVGLHQSPPPLHQPAAVCSKLGLPVEEFTANGELSLNCLSHPRGQPQILFIVSLGTLLFAESP